MLKDSIDDALAEHRELYSGLVRLHVLHHAVEEPIFGLGMMEELGRHGYKVSPGMFYPLLHSMEKKGLLRSWPGRTRNDRRVYRATAEGRKALTAAKQRVQELFSELFEDSAGARSMKKPAKRKGA
ncbi:MAG TPA: helix-turn-helix transcriptional regulator [Candidatus Sulfotelmatobacter sp.]|nr:helix-turn-helix transcriptional regulator [Candidatus Sulfotelmatobacter sp.]